MKNKAYILTLIAYPVLLLAGCTLPDAQKEAAQPASHTVFINQMAFSPAELTVRKGDTITWINQDMVEHNVTEAATKAWHSPTLPRGGSWSLVASAPAAYLCTIHPGMKGHIAVQ